MPLRKSRSKSWKFPGKRLFVGVCGGVGVMEVHGQLTVIYTHTSFSIRLMELEIVGVFVNMMCAWSPFRNGVVYII